MHSLSSVLERSRAGREHFTGEICGRREQGEQDERIFASTRGVHLWPASKKEEEEEEVKEYLRHMPCP
jgi:hypothetical protein